MRRALAIAALVIACTVSQTAAVRADACTADPNGGLVCGAGKDAVRVFDDTVSPSRQYAFAWRTSEGLPKGDDIPDEVENLLIRVADGAVLTRLGGRYWATGQMRANRYDLVAGWSPDNRAVIEVANSRWDSDSFAYYRIDGATAAKLDLLAPVKPAVFAKAGISPKKRAGYAFRIRDDQPVTLDARGRVDVIAELFVPKSDDDNLEYKVRLEVVTKGGKLSARVVSVRKTRVD